MIARHVSRPMKSASVERPHRVVHAKLHDGVDGFGRADAFVEREDRFVDHRHENAVGDKARKIIDLDRRLAQLWPALSGLRTVSSEVARPRMTSTSFITGTGFMKCMPITRSARLVAAPNKVMEIEDVLLARIAGGGSAASMRRKSASLSVSSSLAASMAMTASTGAPRIRVKADAAKQRVGVRARELGFVHRARQGLLDRRVPAAVRRLVHVMQQYSVACSRADLCDARSHLTGSDHENRHPPLILQKRRPPFRAAIIAVSFDAAQSILTYCSAPVEAGNSGNLRSPEVSADPASGLRASSAHRSVRIAPGPSEGQAYACSGLRFYLSRIAEF